MSTSLEALESRRSALLRHIQLLGEFYPGSISATSGRCGNPRCRCRQPDHPGHGPNLRLTFRRNGKTVTLHIIEARLQGGILNKGRRGELQSPLPVGLVYNSANQPVLDPDKQVQQSLRCFFGTFQRTG